ncbi:hypothetical protein [Paraburkholderia bannensis]|uniref:hypothetical protein n=1 Tax=Paraburkholderia bannensis TaxID=765414 RepID=UPI002AC35BB0|nr:hypothetical protein [Paraburkholderia bannensis]
MSRAIPEAWIEKLFARMASIWGSRFADMWRDTDLDEVKSVWRASLSDVTDDGLRRGVSKLIHHLHPPDLPAFRRLCEAEPAMYQQNTLALTDERRTPPEQAREQLAQIRDLAKGLLREHGAPAGGGIRWAYRLLQRAADGERITPHQIAFAKEAIENFNRTHGRAKREPGSDDE